MNKKIFVSSAMALAVAVFAAFYFYKKNDVPSTLPQRKVSISTDFIKPHSQTFGNDSASVTVVEWFDPECESCRAIHPVLINIIADYKDRVYFVMRYMPFHPNSMFAASVLEEAKEIGKFEQALDILFEKQPEWGGHHSPRPDLIPGYLETIGIPVASLNREAVMQKHSSKILIDQADGKKVGVVGTPTFFVNEQMVRGLGDQELRNAIDLALAETQK